MGKIKVLSEFTANKIAAGEVVERPASVVKELMENSLDAGAREISVSVRHGGKSYISVKDDGQGMDREDARACLQRHATSKLSDAEEIERIETLGFRGEALPSIAAVSRFSLITRQQTDNTATLIKASGEVVEPAGECVSNPGTEIEVSDLFFNTPARRKFLKSDAAENNAIADVFNALSLSRSDVSFFLNRSGKEVANYSACRELLQRIEQVYSPDFTDKLSEIAVDKPDFRLTGYIGAPDYTRVNRTGQKFFINSRPVQSVSFSAALGRAYEEFLPQRRFPVAILFLEIDRGYVDVNAHPAKREVRIRSERFFQDVIIKAIQKVLNEKGFFYGKTVRPDNVFPSERLSYGQGPGKLSFHTMKDATAEWEPENQKPGPSENTGADIFLKKHNVPEPHQDTIITPDNSNPFGVVNVLGQVLGTYIIAETEEGFAVFDQHAAHERILYEEILDSFTKNKTSSQQVMFPVTLHLNLQETPLMEEYMDNFHKTGFSINPLGGNTFSIDAVPAFMPETDPGSTIKDTLHELMERSSTRAWETRQQDFAAILACKTYSVKAGNLLDVKEMEHLIKRLGTKRNPHTCPHGRPTFFLMTKDELERRFKRK